MIMFFNKSKYSRVLSELRKAFKFGILNNFFGPGTFAATLVLAYLQAYHSSLVNAENGTSGLKALLIALSLGLLGVCLYHAFVLAPYRTWRIFHPFAVKITSGKVGENLPKAMYERYGALIQITNCSYKRREDCFLHLVGLKGCDGSNQLPRLIEKFSIEPGETKPVTFASWSKRESPLNSDKDLTICGPVTPGYGGNVFRIPSGKYEMKLRIVTSEGDEAVVQSHVWLDEQGIVAF